MKVTEQTRKVVRVTDNVNTHGPDCLYEAFEPARARRIAERNKRRVEVKWQFTTAKARIKFHRLYPSTQ